MSECRLTPNKQFVSYVMARTSCIQCNYDDVLFVLDQTLYWIFIFLAQWNNKLFWFRANQSFLLHMNTACIAEKQQILVLCSLVWPKPTGTWTHDIPHSRRLLLHHHRGSLLQNKRQYIYKFYVLTLFIFTTKSHIHVFIYWQLFENNIKYIPTKMDMTA